MCLRFASICSQHTRALIVVYRVLTAAYTVDLPAIFDAAQAVEQYILLACPLVYAITAVQWHLFKKKNSQNLTKFLRLITRRKT